MIWVCKRICLWVCKRICLWVGVRVLWNAVAGHGGGVCGVLGVEALRYWVVGGRFPPNRSFHLISSRASPLRRIWPTGWKTILNLKLSQHVSRFQVVCYKEDYIFTAYIILLSESCLYQRIKTFIPSSFILYFLSCPLRLLYTVHSRFCSECVVGLVPRVSQGIASCFTRPSFPSRGTSVTAA